MLKQMKTYVAKKEDFVPRWYVVDAQGKVLGRLAVKLATILMGKHRPTYTPHVDTGDFIVVLNADKVKVTGKKLDMRFHKYYSGYPGGLRTVIWRKTLQLKPTFLLKEAVRRMLPKSNLGAKMLTKLKLYTGTKHPHEAQVPEALEL
jgi:large subunit ribosomal protein L13